MRARVSSLCFVSCVESGVSEPGQVSERIASRRCSADVESGAAPGSAPTSFWETSAGKR